MADENGASLQGKYIICFNPLSTIVYDEHGALCSLDESRIIALALAEAYAPGAYVYLGVKETSETDGRRIFATDRHVL